jgi:hypothetical protein
VFFVLLKGVFVVEKCVCCVVEKVCLLLKSVFFVEKVGKSRLMRNHQAVFLFGLFIDL